jgi:general secretion pathway protein D
MRPNAHHHNADGASHLTIVRPAAIVPASVNRALLAALACALLASCAYKPNVIPPSEGHISAERALPGTSADDAPPPVRSSSYVVPAPRATEKPQTYSVVVSDVPVKELLFALARDTRQNIDIHPGLSGLVSLNAINETLPAILDRIARQVNMRYRVDGTTVVVQPDTPYLKTYRVNYVNMSRETDSRIGVSGQIAGPSGTSGGGGGGTGGSSGGAGGAAGSSNASQTTVRTISNNNFWEALRDNIRAIITSTRAQAQSTEDRQQRAEAERSAREERLAQAEAVARAGAGAVNLFKEAFSASADRRPLPGEVRDEIVVNSVAGTVSVIATDKQHALVQQHIDSIISSVQRQVLIEATIAEVRLSDRYRAGVDWSRLAVSGGISFQQQMLSGNLNTPPSLTIGYTNPASVIGNIAASVRLLEQFGNTRVLSSPKLMALNNQTALLKVVDNIVYFSIEAQTNTTQGVAVQNFTTTAHTVPVGVIMSLTPQINEDGRVTLTVRPTISRILGFKNDPNPSLGTGATRIVNAVPEIQVREMESVLQVGSGQTVILGGLMQDDASRSRDQIPGIGSIPGVGEAFGYRDDNLTRTELVIFLRPVVVNNPSVDSDELKFYRRFLPETGKK